MVTHFNILAWRIPWAEEPGRLFVPKSWAQLKRFSHTHGSRQGNTGEIYPLYISPAVVTGLIIKFSQNRFIREKQILICVYGGPVEMRPKKWPKQAIFILFRQRHSKFVRN